MIVLAVFEVVAFAVEFAVPVEFYAPDVFCGYVLLSDVAGVAAFGVFLSLLLLEFVALLCSPFHGT